jgi:1,5-anhydro-D-fructose reductase (1,5-anhydro-D-mannitol-forming)
VTAPDTIRWGMIGCGNVTEVKSGPAFQKAQGSSLVAVMRRDQALVEDYARRHGVPRWYTRAEDLINDPEVDAVYIATPPHMHHPYTLLAARAGKPVYVEKPMALNSAQCQEMIDACREAGVPLFVAYYRRALPRFLKVRELVERGAIGAVRSVQVLQSQPLQIPPVDQVPWRLLPDIAGGGMFVDQASHTLDYLDFLLGPVRRVSGFAANQAGAYAAEDQVWAAFEFDSGAAGVGTWCFNAHTHSDQISLLGSEGRLTLTIYDEQPVVLENAAGVQSFPIFHPPHIQQPLIQQVVDELHGLGRCSSTGESAMRTTWVMEQLLNPYYARP